MLYRIRNVRRFQVSRSCLRGSLDGASYSVRPACYALPASYVTSDIREVRFQFEPRGQSGFDFTRSLRPRERLRWLPMRGTGFEARCSASTAHRPRSMDVARRIIARDRRSGTALKSGSRFGPPSPCNSVRLGICEFVSLQRL